MELSGTAVVTGAASGIGLSLCRRFARAGMNVVMADVEEPALAEAEDALRQSGAEVLAVVTDTSELASVAALHQEAVGRFGSIQVLCNNAGVAGGGGPLWETTDEDWRWVVGVNLMGVVNGIRAFVPEMVARGGPAHVVNTSSVLGLSTGGGSIYSVTKHAVARLSEGLWYDLRAAGAGVGVSVLCPGMVATRIVSAERNRPAVLGNEAAGAPAAEERRRAREAMQERFLREGMDPDQVAEQVADAIRTGRFYVLTHPEMIKPAVEARMRAILDEADPPPLARLL